MEEQAAASGFEAGGYMQPPVLFKQEAADAELPHGPANGDPAQSFAVDATTQLKVEPAQVPAEQAEAGGERKRRHRWGPPAGGEFAKADAEGAPKKKRRSRWESSDELVMVPVTSKTGAIIIPGQIPKEITLSSGLKVALVTSQTELQRYADPKLERLHKNLQEFDRKLTANELDIPPEYERSPSPEPIYDANGVRLNTREIRAREKLTDKRNRCIEEIIKLDPEYKPPADYKPRKFWRKVYIPINEYPGYNFIGLIIGPRGNTQKRMQKETNCKIAIRGKGSVKEGASKDPKYDYGEDEELHVLVTGETQEDVDSAAGMIEKLCTPQDEEHNEHKRLQLRELAALNGTLKDLEACYLCGEEGHAPEHCPNKALEVYKLPENMLGKVQEQYERDVARVRGEPVTRLDDEYKSFLSELGGAPPPEMMGIDTSKSSREQLPDECKLYVGNLPTAYDNNMLRQLFESIAKVVHTAVITDPGTGLSRGFGFVHIPDKDEAKSARDQMDGRMIDGKTLTVRLRSERHSTTGGGGSGGGGGGPRNQEIDEHKLYVAGLTSYVQEAALRQLFGQYGEVTDVRTIMDRETNQCKGYAFIGFRSKSDAANAKEGLDGYKYDGKVLTVRIAGIRGERPKDSGAGGAFNAGHLGQIRGPGQYGIPAPAPPPGAPPPPGVMHYQGAPGQSQYPGYPPHSMPGPGGQPGFPAPAPPQGAHGYPGAPAPPPGFPPGVYGAPAYGAPPGAPPPGYGMPPTPPGYGYPPGAAVAPGYPPYGGYPAPAAQAHPAAPPAGAYPGAPPLPPGYSYADPSQAAAAAAAAAAAGGGGGPQQHGFVPPLPGQPPLPPPEAGGGAPPPPPPPQDAQQEYDRFMQDLARTLQ